MSCPIRTLHIDILKDLPEVAKDSNASPSTRLTATKDMVHDKVDEKKHHTRADVEKNKAT